MGTHPIFESDFDCLTVKMAEEFRIQHLAAVLSKSLKTTVKGDQMSREFLENKTKFVTAQVNTHNANRIIAESSGTPKEFLAIYDELKARNVRILNGLVYILEHVTADDQLKNFIEAQALYLGGAKQTRHGRPLDAAAYTAHNTPLKGVDRDETMTLTKTILSNKTNLLNPTSATVEGVEAFQSMLNKSIDTGKRKIGSGNNGSGDHTLVTLSRDTILDVNMQELNSRFNKSNAPFALRQPDWWNNDATIGTVKTLQGKLASLPESNQEYLIVEDILSLLHGGEASHFTSEMSGTSKKHYAGVSNLQNRRGLRPVAQIADSRSVETGLVLERNSSFRAPSKRVSLWLLVACVVG